MWRRLRRLHEMCALTLAPSSAAAWALARHGIEPVRLWARGVDAELFDPARRSARIRSGLVPAGELLVGYVGRLAPEKRLQLLAPAARLPGVRVVIVGDGPSRASLQRRLPACRERRDIWEGTRAMGRHADSSASGDDRSP